MTTKKDNLVKLAKGLPDKKVKAPIVKKVKEEVEKVLTPNEERDLKAKAKVDELLDGVKLTPETKKEELLEVDVEVDDEPKGMEWLEEQVTKLAEENEKLKSEAALAKEDYSKLFQSFQQLKNNIAPVENSDGMLQAKVVQLFNELQANHLSMGGNFIIYPVGFMNRLIVFFPFLEKYKRF